MSSRYTMTISQIIPPSTICMARWNVAGTPHSPNGILTNWYSPNFVINAVLHLSSSAIGICQNPEFISRVQNQVLLTKLSRHSSIKGNGYASFSVLELTALKSMQYLQEPSRLPPGAVSPTQNDYVQSPQLPASDLEWPSLVSRNPVASVSSTAWLEKTAPSSDNVSELWTARYLNHMRQKHQQTPTRPSSPWLLVRKSKFSWLDHTFPVNVPVTLHTMTLLIDWSLQLTLSHLTPALSPMCMMSSQQHKITLLQPCALNYLCPQLQWPQWHPATLLQYHAPSYWCHSRWFSTHSTCHSAIR